MSVVSEPSDPALPTAPALRSRWDPAARAQVLVVSGEVDPYTQEQLRAALSRAVRDGRVVVDLSEATGLSGRAIGLLNRHRADLAAVLVAEGSLIARALSYSGFSRWVPVLAGHPAGDALPAGWPADAVRSGRPGGAARPGRSGGDADGAERDLPAQREAQ